MWKQMSECKVKTFSTFRQPKHVNAVTQAESLGEHAAKIICSCRQCTGDIRVVTISEMYPHKELEPVLELCIIELRDTLFQSLRHRGIAVTVMQCRLGRHRGLWE